MFVRTTLTLLLVAAPLFAADPPLPEGAFARLGSPHWRNLTDANINSLIAFSPDGKSVITQGYGAVHIVDFESGAERWRVDGIRGEFSMAIAPKNRLLVCERASLRLYDLLTGKELRRIPMPAQNCSHLATDGKQVVFQDLFGKAPLAAVCVDLETGQKRWKHGGGQVDFCYPLGLVADYSELVLRVYKHPDTWLRVIDLDTQQLLREWKLPANFERDRLNPAALSPDGKLAGTGGDKNIHLWNVGTGKEHAVLTGHTDDVVRVAFSGDGRRLVTSGRDLTLRWWDLASGKELGKIICDNMPNVLAVSPDGDRVAAACAGSNALHRFDLKAGREIPQGDGHSNLIEQLAFLPDGSKLLSAGRDGSVRVWDLASRKTIRSWRREHEGLTWLSVSADGKLAATADDNGRVVRIWDIASGTEQRSFRFRQLIGPLAFAPTKTLLAISLADSSPDGSTIHLVDAQSGKELQRLAGHPGGIGSLSFISHGAAVLSTIGSRGIGLTFANGAPARLESLTTGKALAMQSQLDRDITAFSSGRQAALVRQSGRISEITLVELATARVRLKIQHDYFFFGHLALSPDGSLLVAQGSFPNQHSTREPGVYLFSAATGKLLRRFDAGHTCTFVFSPDGKTLATGGMDGTVLLWDLSKIKATEVNAKRNPDKLWADLLADAPRAYQAIVAVGAGGEEGAELLRERLKPAVPLDAAQITKLLDDLESPQFAVRQKAAARLASLDERVASALRARLKTTTSAEARKTISHLLEQLDGWLTQPQVLREVRAVEAMERNDSPAARQLLEEWVKGDPNARLTREAKAGLKWKEHLATVRGK